MFSSGGLGRQGLLAIHPGSPLEERASSLFLVEAPSSPSKDCFHALKHAGRGYTLRGLLRELRLLARPQEHQRRPRQGQGSTSKQGLQQWSNTPPQAEESRWQDHPKHSSVLREGHLLERDECPSSSDTLQAGRHSCSPGAHFWRHSCSEWKLFRFPLQPPKMNRWHVWLVTLNHHLGKEARHRPTTLGKRQVSGRGREEI